MTIYDIDAQIRSIIENCDPETGEIDGEALDALQMARDTKVENLILAIKNMTAEAKAIKDEETTLAARRRTVENAAKRAKEYLEHVLAGEAFKTARCAASWRRTKRVEVDADFVSWATENAKDLLRIREPEPDKTAIGELLKAGKEIPHAALVETASMTIK